MNKRRKGISLIVLVITILVMIILAGVVVVSLSKNNPIEKAKEATFKQDMASFRDELSVYIANGQIINDSVKLDDYNANTYDEIKKIINSFMQKYNKKVVIISGELVYAGQDTLEEKWAEEIGMPIINAGENSPDMVTGMIPIKCVKGTWEVCSPNDPEWYCYGLKKWANAMLSDGKYKAGSVTVGTKVAEEDLGSMFVWIPRFAYSMDKYKVKSNFNVTFLNETSNKDSKGNSYEEDYNVTKISKGEKTPKIVHPAFKLGAKPMRGFWIAKFEASKEGANNNTVAGNNLYDNIKILPNKNTWRYIQISHCMVNSMVMNEEGNVYGLVQPEANSYLTRNVEWGAVCYLAASQFGRSPEQNTNKINTSGVTYTQLSGGGDYIKNVQLSTTGNVTGVYDISGGAAEYVAAFYNNKNKSIITYGSDYFFANGYIKDEFVNYLDSYEVSPEEITLGNTLWNDNINQNSKRLEFANARYEKSSSKKGDAMYEVTDKGEYSYYGKLNDGIYGWMKDLTSDKNQYITNGFGNLSMFGNTELPFIVRGGSWDHAGKVGMFSQASSRGIPFYEYGFRPVVIKK